MLFKGKYCTILMQIEDAFNQFLNFDRIDYKIIVTKILKFLIIFFI